MKYKPGDIIGPYIILEKLPKGGMADVYIARPCERYNGPQHVAIKVASRGNNDFLKYEAAWMRGIEHPRILRMLPIATRTTTDETLGKATYTRKTKPYDPRSPYYIVMEYMHGGSLVKYLAARGGRLQTVEAMRIAYQVAEALAYVHAQKIVHLDVKPNNILLRRSVPTWSGTVPDVVLSDFGISQRVDGAQYEELRGTPPYIAPERRENHAPQPTNDIFGLGVVLYEMLTGRAPFEGLVISQTPPITPQAYPRALNPDVSQELEQVVLRSIAPNPYQRYTVMHQVLNDLRRTPEAQRTSTILRAVPNWVTIMGIMIIGLTVVLLVATLVGVLGNPERPGSPVQPAQVTSMPQTPASPPPTVRPGTIVPAQTDETPPQSTLSPATSTPLVPLPVLTSSPATNSALPAMPASNQQHTPDRVSRTGSWHTRQPDSQARSAFTGARSAER